MEAIQSPSVYSPRLDQVTKAEIREALESALQADTDSQKSGLYSLTQFAGNGIFFLFAF
jgi:hypothetical protein